MTVQPVETLRCGSVGLDVSEDWKPVEGPSQRQSRADPVGEVNRGYVVVVIVGPACMAPELVKFAGKISVRAPILLDRVKDGNAIRRNGDRAAE